MIVVDVETTGIDPQKHSIVSVGAIHFPNPENVFYGECRIWDGAEIWEGFEGGVSPLDYNGFTKEQITDPNKPSVEDLIKKFFDWVSDFPDKTIAGHNPLFDRGFLEASAGMAGLKWTFGYRMIDLHSLVYTHHLRRRIQIPLSKERTDINIDRALVYAGLPPEPRPHNALTGAKMEAEAFSRLIYGRSLLEEFKECPVPEYLK